MKKIILMKESAFQRLFEAISEYDTPQQFVMNLKKGYNFGTLPSSQMTNEEIAQIIQDELSSNQELSEFNGVDNISRYNFIETVTQQNGKIYIERAISLMSVDDIFSYDGLGTSWSWAKGGGANYFGDGRFNILLKGYVNAEDIDWERTVFLNAYPLNEQKEIRVKTNVGIELTNFVFNGRKLKLKKPIILNSGSHDIDII